MNLETGTPMKTTMEFDHEALLSEMRIAHKHGVPGIGARVLANAERKLEMIRCSCESMRAVARILSDDLARGK